MLKIVVVEDNSSYAEDVADYLVKSGYAVRVVGQASELWLTLAAEPADLVLLDLGLPDEDGFAIIPKMRKLYPASGLIVLTARVTFDNRVQGLRLGADAYLTKPIKFPELAANIEAVCRRLQPQDAAEQASPWRLCTAGYRLELQGQGAMPLAEKEFSFLHLLTQSRLPVPRESLLIGMGEANDLVAARRMDMLVYRLRRKVRAAWAIELPLRSAYGGGFALTAKFELA